MVDSVEKIPYDKGWSWMIVLGMHLMHFFLIGYMKTFGLIFVELQEIFNLSSQQTAWVSTATLLTIDILSPLGTALGDWFGSRCVVMTGGLIVCISLCLSSLLINIGYMITVLGFMFGFGATLCYAPSLVMLGQYFRRRLGLANALAVTGSSMGQFLLPPLLAYLLDEFSLRQTLLLMGGIMFNLSLAGALLRPTSHYISTELNEHTYTSVNTDCPTKPTTTDLPNECGDVNGTKCETQSLTKEYVHAELEEEKYTELPRKTDSYVKPVCDIASATSLFNTSLINLPKLQSTEDKNSPRTYSSFIMSVFDVRLLTNPVYTLFAVGLTCVNFSYIGTFRYLPAHCKDIHIGPHERAMMLSLVGISDLVARLVIGAVADTEFIRVKLTRCRLLAVSQILLSVNGFLLVESRTFSWLVVSCALYGVFGGMYMTLVSVSLVDLLGPKCLSRAWGIMLLLYSFTAIGEPLVLGYLRDITGSYNASFQTCAAGFLVGGVLVFAAPFTRKSTHPNTGT